MPKTTSTKKPTTKKAAAKKTAAKKRSGVLFDGKPAMNRHFLLDRVLVEAAVEKAEEDGIRVSDVLRYGVRQYGSEAPKAPVSGQGAGRVMPAEAHPTLRRIWESGDSELMNHYLAAAHRAGWTTRAIADSLVEAGAVQKMTRQAVSLRVLKAPDELRDDVPEVPELGPRRVMVSSKKVTKARENSYDMAFRVANDEYELASRRAKSEGAMMSSVLDNVLLGYTNDEFEVEEILGLSDDDES